MIPFTLMVGHTAPLSCHAHRLALDEAGDVKGTLQDSEDSVKRAGEASSFGRKTYLTDLVIGYAR